MRLFLCLLLLLLPVRVPAASIQLAWDHEASVRPDTFVIQRSLDGGATWQEIGQRPGALGTTITWTDAHVPEGAAPPVLLYTVRARLATQVSGPSNLVRTSPGGQPRVAGTALTIPACDSQELTAANNACRNAVYLDTSLIWHTQWSAAQPPLPHWIVIDVGTEALIDGLAYLPRQDTQGNGTIKDYTIAVSLDGQTWSAPVAQGTWLWPTRDQEQIVRWPQTQGRYVRLTATKEVNGQPYSSASIISLFAGPGPNWTPPPPLGATCVRTQPEEKVVVLTCKLP